MKYTDLARLAILAGLVATAVAGTAQAGLPECSDLLANMVVCEVVP